MKVVTERETGFNTGALEAVRDQFMGWNDESSAALTEDLIRKQAAGELTLAFCGHFSAGKSSMINALCGKKVLPSGPVPTSANVVTIRNGASKAVIHRPDGGLGETMSVSTEELAAYCKEGGEYSAIEVWDDVSILGEHGVLMDTPGVDSTDDGHRQATHSALHMADVVFYVMDYNHVQSESNLLFAKSLSDWGKPLYLIVNQIDKHRDEELPLTSYLGDVKKAFAQWKVRYNGLMCVSLKVWDHPYNQWEDLKSVIDKLLGSRKALLNYSVECSVRHAADRHAEAFLRSHQEEKEQLLAEMGGEAAAAALKARMDELDQEHNKLQQLPDEVRGELRREGDSLLANANLMPADIRDLALSFLESRRSGFKKGFLFTSSKTDEEKSRRLDVFHQRLTEQVLAQVDWHVRNLVKPFVERFEPWSSKWDAAMDSLLPVLSTDHITNTVNTDAVLSGEYVLNYCKLLSEEIKGSYRKAISELADQLRVLAADDAAVRLEALERQRAELLAQSSASARYAALQQAEADRALAAAQLVPPLTSLTPGLLPEVREPAAGPQAAASAGSPAERQGNGGPAPQRSAPQSAAGGRRQRLEAAATELRAAAQLLAPHPALASPARDLHARADALAGGTFTLALFGAFSAGKSSFANALLGESVLPVSPHPTTAAVNRIVLPTEEHPHGTAAVRMKTKEVWWDDLKYSFSVLGLSEPNEDNWRKTANGLTPEGVHPAGLPHYGFLKAAAAGYEEMNGKLGSVQSVGMEEYRGFVADETKSCYVDGIDLYYSSPLTEQGIVLVDTPGADSLHARHTGVTFNYIKNADAIVYVTYYNHAFSKADRQFLSQLGRVKDSFALDKMFFVVNAADLASSSDELEEVVSHVRTNLIRNGVANPHIYPVSSLSALKGKLHGNDEELESSGFIPFEKSLDRFAVEDLPGLSLRAGYDEIASVRRRAEAWAELAEQDEDTRSRRIEGLEKVRLKAQDYFKALKSMDMTREITQECGELLFHVRQRLDYAMGRFFQEAFHPSVLREDAGSLKSAFAACGRDLQRTLSIELDQEFWATTLRLEQKGRRLTEDAARQTAQALGDLTEGLEFSVRQDREWATPLLEETELSLTEDWLSYWSNFKNPKHFFEGAGSVKLREAAEPNVKESVTIVVKQREAQMASHYANEIAHSLELHARVLQEQLEESLNAMLVSLQDGQSPEMWRTLAHELATMERNS